MENEKDVKVLGGMSMPGMISIVSDRYSVTASHSHKKGEAGCHIDLKTHSAFEKTPIIGFLFQRKFLRFMPRVLYLSLFMIATSWPFFIIWAFLMMLTISTPGLNEVVSFRPQYDIPMIFGILVLMRFFVARWHGAEHMTIAAWWAKQSTEIEDIKKESPVNAKCGTRLLFPLILGLVLGTFLYNLGITWLLTWVVLLLDLEIVLWIDKLIGFDKIPIFSHASVFIQRYFNTARPKDCELLTARSAMIKLLELHAEEKQKAQT